MHVNEMTLQDAQTHLEGGGYFSLRGGTMRVIALPGEGRYVLINDSGNGADHVQPRLTTVLDLMEQYAGGDLAPREAVSA